MPYFPFIDGLRAIAVVGVILFHFGLGFPGGYIGVDIFFVLSGFLITTILANRLNQPAGEFFAHFYERRSRRILPALVIMALLSLLAAYFLLLPKEMQFFAKSMRNMAVFFSNFSFSREVGYFDGPAATKPLLHSWSLAVEEQFYLLFPPILYGLAKLLRRAPKALPLLIALAFAGSLAVNLIMINVRPEGAFFLPQARAWELLAGSLIALVGVRYLPGMRAANLFSIAAIVVLGICLFDYTHATKFPGIAAVPPVLATAVLIWANLKQPSIIARMISFKPLVYVGLISYGLYLYHWPVLVFTRFYFGGEPPIWTHWVSIPFIFALAALSFHYIEEPIRHGRWLRRRRDVFFAALLSILLLFGLGQAIGKRGLPERFSDQVRVYASAGDKAINKKVCTKHFSDDVLQATVCVVGDGAPDKPDFLVWGDSHSSALIPAMQVMAERHDRTGWVYANTGCLPLIDMERIDESLDMPCRRAGDTAIALVEKYAIKTVLMAGRWDMYTMGWEPGSEEVTREPVIEHDGKLGLEALAAGLPATRAKLRSLGTNPWVFRQIPPQLNDVPTALATAEYFGRDRISLRREAAPIRAWHASQVAILTAEDASQVIDPLPMFCPENTKFCEIEKDGQSLYSDNDHLSIHGAKQLVPLFERFFQSMR